MLREQKDDFYLTASRMVPYKKIPLIIEAFATMPDKRLVVIGAGPEFARCEAVATPNVELLGYQPFEVLRDHMQRARAFVFAAAEDFGIVPIEAQAFAFPSLYEGFGLPPLEAMASGVPVLAGNLTSLPEVVGDACLLVDPSSVDAVGEGLLALVDDESLRASLIAKGLARSKRFTWDATAEKTWAVLQEVAGG